MQRGVRKEERKRVCGPEGCVPWNPSVVGRCEQGVATMVDKEQGVHRDDKEQKVVECTSRQSCSRRQQV